MTRVAGLGEGLLAAATFVDRQRRVGHEGLRRRARAARNASSSARATGLAEHQALLAAVQPRDHGGGVVHAADVVERDVRLRGGRGRVGATTCTGRRRRRRALHPAPDRVGVADGRREPDALELPAGQPLDPFQHGEQVPAAVGRRRRRAARRSTTARSVAKNRSWSTPPRDEHRLERLRGGRAGCPAARRGCGGARRRRRRRATAPTCGRASRRSCSSRGCRLLSSARSGRHVEHRQCRASASCDHLATAAGRRRPRSCRRPSGRRSTQSSPERTGSTAAACSGRRLGQPRELTTWYSMAGVEAGRARPST